MVVGWETAHRERKNLGNKIIIQGRHLITLLGMAEFEVHKEKGRGQEADQASKTFLIVAGKYEQGLHLMRRNGGDVSQSRSKSAS